MTVRERERLEKLAAMLRETRVTVAEANREERARRPHFQMGWILQRNNWRSKRKKARIGAEG